jgi:hypothetical protein
VQRYGHHNVGLEQFGLGLNKLGEAMREPLSQWLDTLKLQGYDGPDERFLVLRIASGPLKGVGPRCADAANPSVRPRSAFAFGVRPRFSERSLKCGATNLTGPPLQRFERCEAKLADRYPARAGQEAFAQPAARGKQDADNSIANIDEPAALALH